METLTAANPESSHAQTSMRDDGSFVFHHPPKYSWVRDGEVTPRVWHRYSVYVHVPFCRRICTFCTFERKQLRRGSISWFTDRLEREMEMLRQRDDFSAAELESVYLGGGTASLLSNDDVRCVLDRLRAGFGYRDGIETTLESEPGTKRVDDFRAMRQAGINRVSIGIQAFQDDLLRTLNRSHDAGQAVQMVRAAQDGGIENVHIDLMYALPGQTLAQWQESVDRAVALGVTHLSIYQLIVFPNELLARMMRSGAADDQPPSESVNAMRLYAHEQFLAAGYHRYSLSEYCKPGYECRYVRTTWDGSDYLGMGPGAYSRNGSSLWEDDVVHAAYDEKIENDLHPVGKAICMTPREQVARDIALGLCLLEVDLADISRRAGVSAGAEFSETLSTLAARDLIHRHGDLVRLTETGIRYATHVMKAFVS